MVEIWSTYPPPYGGVSVHSMRLFENLKDQTSEIVFKNFTGAFNNSHDRIYNVNVFFIEFLKLVFASKRIVHLHSNKTSLWLAFSLFIWRHTVIVTKKKKKLRKHLAFMETLVRKIFLRKVNYIILNDEDLAQHIIKRYRIKEAKFQVIPAFIPPLPKEEIGLDVSYLDFRKKYEFIISSSAWKLYKTDNIDVYGIDQIIEAIYLLKKEGTLVGLILIIPITEDSEYQIELLNRIKQYELGDQIMLVNKGIPNAFEVWRLSDLYIRATSTDIEGLTIKEAMYYGTPVIASDTVKRPDGCIMYKFNDIENLKNRILEICAGETSYSSSNSLNDTVDKIYALYKNLN